MPQEIERKFLVPDLRRVPLGEGELIQQGYLATTSSCEIRVRLRAARAFLTIKSAQKGRTRSEFEYAIPLAEAQVLLNTLCENTLLKTRHSVNVAGLLWEVDVFQGNQEGLVMAEVELQSEEQPLELPSWIGEEVTEDARYYNANLAKHSGGGSKK